MSNKINTYTFFKRKIYSYYFSENQPDITLNIIKIIVFTYLKFFVRSVIMIVPNLSWDKFP